MIYHYSKKTISLFALITPNTLLPRFGEWATKGRVEFYVWAEIYLVFRFIFSIVAISFLPVSVYVGVIIGIIQISSFIYLLKIVFPVDTRSLRDSGRSLFFALGHYLEIGFFMAYIYWSWGKFSVESLSRVDSVYYSFVTMTTLGYGEIHSMSDLTKILAISQNLVGIFIFAIVIGLFLSKPSQDH